MYRLSEQDLITINKGICSAFHKKYDVLNFDALSACLNAYDSYYEDDNHIASAIFRAIITNHAFKDANKRTAFLALQFINPSKIGGFEIANLTLKVAKNTSMEVDDICDILYPESIEESYNPTYTYKYIGPVYRFEKVYDNLKEPIYTDAKSKEHAVNMIKGKLKKKYGFDMKANLNIDETKVKQTISDPYKFDMIDIKKEINHDTQNFIGSINGYNIYYEDNYFIIDGLEDLKFISMEDIKDYLEESYMNDNNSYSLFADINDAQSLIDSKNLDEGLNNKESNTSVYKQVVERLDYLDNSSIDNNTKFYDLRSCFYSLMEALSAEDREDIKKVIDATKSMPDDKATETIAAVLAAKEKKNESLEEDFDISDYEQLSSTIKDAGDTYALFRKVENGKGKWAAAKYVDGNPDIKNAFEITYEQARGFEPLSNLGKLAKRLGKEILPQESLDEASYGGAYDVEDDMYFTKDDILEFIDKLIEKLDNYFGYSFDIYDVGFDSPTQLYIELIDEPHDINKYLAFNIDMRKIRKPTDLQKYIPEVFERFVQMYQEEYDQWNFDESLQKKVINENTSIIDRLNNILKTSSNEYSAKDVQLFITPKGNINIRTQDDKDIVTVGGNLFSEEEIEDLRQDGYFDNYDNMKLNEKLVDAPQEVIDQVLDVLKQYNFILDDSIKHENPLRTKYGEVHIQIINPESEIDTSDEDKVVDQIKTYVPQDLIDELHRIDSESKCPITWSFGVNIDNKVTAGINIMKQYIEEAAKITETINESYSYDQAVHYIESKGINADPTSYVGEYVCDLLDDFAGDDEEYSKQQLDYIIKKATEIRGGDQDLDLEESILFEDTIKQNGKWVNKGKEGTHGEFKTKKEADAQRRAIWVNWNK